MTQENNGHRQRLRQRMMTEGLQHFQDHEVLEMLLFLFLPRQDTNKLAHRLLQQFGSIAGVLDALPTQLMQVEGISQVTACNVAVLKETWIRYKRSLHATDKPRTLNDLLQYAKYQLCESYTERMIVAYVNDNKQTICTDEMDSLSTDYVVMDVKRVVSSALRVNAFGVVIFHSHVNTTCEPSDNDNLLTQKVRDALDAVGIQLIDHLIINTNGDYFSYRQNTDFIVKNRR